MQRMYSGTSVDGYLTIMVTYTQFQIIPKIKIFGC